MNRFLNATLPADVMKTLDELQEALCWPWSPLSSVDCQQPRSYAVSILNPHRPRMAQTALPAGFFLTW